MKIYEVLDTPVKYKINYENSLDADYRFNVGDKNYQVKFTTYSTDSDEDITSLFKMMADSLKTTIEEVMNKFKELYPDSTIVDCSFYLQDKMGLAFQEVNILSRENKNDYVHGLNFKVLTTVNNIIIDYTNKYNHDYLFFTSRESSRTSLYKKIIQLNKAPIIYLNDQLKEYINFLEDTYLIKI